jgi:hypothetical protein
MFRSDLLRSKPGGSSFLLQTVIDAAYSPENPSKYAPIPITRVTISTTYRMRSTPLVEISHLLP